MKNLTSKEIREMWFHYFQSKGHKKEESYSLIPENDKTLLWINAGVTPLKKYFDGSIVPENKRIVTIQKCIRTNDIDNVGVTKRHHTMFEMMGNFSIGDYFRDEAIEFSFELLTSPSYFDIPKEKLYMTVYPNDTETYNKWISLGVDPTHIAKLEDNFWEIGNGPCGPDTEIFFDRGSKYDPDNTAYDKFMRGADNERYIEIWNNVLSQFNSEEGLSRENYKELPSKNIDTGAGLERWATIFQNVDSAFETDLFVPIIKEIEEITGLLYNGDVAFKVIADHIRALTFALSDGAEFENTGRGYILRRLLRRSTRYGRKLGINEPFMYRLVDEVVVNMEDVYPYLISKMSEVKIKILDEENLFNKTLMQGERRLNELLQNKTSKIISGYDAFKLYDTYGFPYELSLEYAREAGFTIDKEGFDKYMEEAKKLSKQNNNMTSSMNIQNKDLLSFTKKDEFISNVISVPTKIIGIFKDNEKANSINKEGYVILEKTCLYATSGGQIHDTGMITGKKFVAHVTEVIKAPNGQHLHKVRVLNGTINSDDRCDVKLDISRRNAIAKNHSAAHLLHYALRHIISENIHQDGSRVDDQTLRFDFHCPIDLNEERIVEVEKLVKELINTNVDTEIKEMSLEEAKKTGAMALFNEKYGKIVRVVKIGPSLELCGGTHIKNISNIKEFAILSYENKGFNTYRIEASTSDIEKHLIDRIKPYNDGMIKQLIKAKEVINIAKANNIELDFHVDIDNSKPTTYKDIIYNRNELNYVTNEVKQLEKKYHEEKNKLALLDIESFKKDIININDKYVLIKIVENYDIDPLKEILDDLANKYLKIFAFIINKKANNYTIIVKSSSELNAATILKDVLSKFNGNGGGSPTFATGGIKNIDDINKLIEEVKSRIS